METEKEWTELEEKKQYLKSYQKALRREDDILEEIQQLRMEKMFPATHMEGLPRVAGYSDLSIYAAKVDELIRSLKRERLERIQLREKIERSIDQIRDEDEKAVIRYRYIQGMKWEDVCIKIGFSWKQTHRIHSNALNNLKRR